MTWVKAISQSGTGAIWGGHIWLCSLALSSADFPCLLDLTVAQGTDDRHCHPCPLPISLLTFPCNLLPQMVSGEWNYPVTSPTPISIHTVISSLRLMLRKNNKYWVMQLGNTEWVETFFQIKWWIQIKGFYFLLS